MTRRVLHAGCGGSPLPAYFPEQGAVEVRLDIDPAMKPDVVASLTDMGDIGEFDALFCAHCLEHLYPHDVPRALAEFARVLKPGGFAMVIVPDLEGLVLTESVLYTTGAGLAVTAFDLYYGHRRLIEANPYMAHHSGFTAPLLEDAMRDAGFETLQVKRAGDYNLIAVGFMPKREQQESAGQPRSQPVAAPNF
jgi:SAM-dependent methyltransferase